MTIIGNNKVFSDTIQNFSANPYRRVDLTRRSATRSITASAIRLLKERLARSRTCWPRPRRTWTILQFTAAGPLLCVRPYCSNPHYWQVYFDTNRVIRESFGEAGFPAAVPAYAVTGLSAGPPLDGTASAWAGVVHGTLYAVDSLCPHGGPGVTLQERQRSLIEFLDVLVQRRVRTPVEDEQFGTADAALQSICETRRCE